MNELQNTTGTISTIELRDIVNEARKAMGESEVQNNQFIKRVEDELEGELEGQKYIDLAPRTKTPMVAYDLTHEQAMLVGMRESKAVRRKVLGKIKTLQEAQKPAVPQSYAAALLEAGRLAQLAEEQAEQLALAAPKVEFVDRYVESVGNKGFREVCKLLKAKEPEFRQFLANNKIMYRLGGSWTAYQQHIDAGRFAVNTGAADNGHAYTAAKFTPKGISWIAGEWAKHQLGVAV